MQQWFFGDKLKNLVSLSKFLSLLSIVVTGWSTGKDSYNFFQFPNISFYH